jgi:hypothetical protein
MRLINFTALVLTLSVTGIVNAASNAVPIGSSLGYGEASNNKTLFNMSNNPAWVSGNLHEENNYGIGTTIGIRIKQKRVNKLTKTYNNKISPLLDNFKTVGVNTLSNAMELKEEMNSLILDIRDNFYLQADVNFALPLLVANSAIGAVGFEVSEIHTLRGAVLSSDSPVALDASYLLTNPTASLEDVVENGLIVQSALYTKTAQAKEAALTYGNQFYQNQSGQLSIGIRAKLMQIQLGKSINSFAKYLKADKENLEKDLENHKEITNSSNSFGLDLGVQWFTKNYMTGLAITNINSPSFNYNKLGTGSDEQSNIENFYGNQISLKEKLTLNPQARVEGAFFSKNRDWSFAGSLDLNPANDYVNQQYQWATISAAYATQGGSSWIYYLIPDLRLGYRKNLVGDEISYITTGLSWGPLNLDLGFTSLNDLSGGSDTPDGAMLNLGLEVHF